MRVLLVFVLVAVLVSTLSAQQGTQAPATQDRLLEMQAIAAALGVKCEYCHGAGPDAPRPVTAAGKARQDVALEIMAMTRRSSYDFSEDSILLVAERLANARPAVAIARMAMNLEFYPKSVRSYVVLAQAQARQQDGAAAIASLRKALEIEPENGTVKGRLLQLERQYERKP